MHTCHLTEPGSRSRKVTVGPACPTGQMPSEPWQQSSRPGRRDGQQFTHGAPGLEDWRTESPSEEEEVGVYGVWEGGRKGVWGSVFYFSQLLWKEPQELKSKEQHWNNVQDLTKASAPFCRLPAVACLSWGSVWWVISHTPMLGRVLPPGEGGSRPALHTPGVDFGGHFREGESRAGRRQPSTFPRRSPWKAILNAALVLYGHFWCEWNRSRVQMSELCGVYIENLTAIRRFPNLLISCLSWY